MFTEGTTPLSNWRCLMTDAERVKLLTVAVEGALWALERERLEITVCPICLHTDAFEGLEHDEDCPGRILADALREVQA